MTFRTRRPVHRVDVPLLPASHPPPFHVLPACRSTQSTRAGLDSRVSSDRLLA